MPHSGHSSTSISWLSLSRAARAPGFSVRSRQAYQFEAEGPDIEVDGLPAPRRDRPGAGDRRHAIWNGRDGVHFAPLRRSIEGRPAVAMVTHFTRRAAHESDRSSGGSPRGSKGAARAPDKSLHAAHPRRSRHAL